MAFSLAFTSCLQNCCEYLSITDTTGVYPTVSTGWEQDGISTLISGATITAATITVNKINTDYSILVANIANADVLSSYGSAVTGDITFPSIAPNAGGKYTDGLYDIIFSVTDNDGVVHTTDIKQFFFCQTNCCIDKMILEISNAMCEACSTDAYLEKVNKATVLRDSLKALVSANCLANANTTLALLQDICSFNNCNCN